MINVKWNEETLQHFKFQSNYTGAEEVLKAVKIGNLFGWPSLNIHNVTNFLDQTT